MDKKTDWEYINAQTGNVIGYLSLPAELGQEELKWKLEEKRVTLATSHKLGLDQIYWQDKDHPIK